MKWILLIGLCLFVGFMIYKQTKKDGTSKGEGATITTPDEEKGKPGDQAY